MIDIGSNATMSLCPLKLDIVVFDVLFTDHCQLQCIDQTL